MPNRPVSISKTPSTKKKRSNFQADRLKKERNDLGVTLEKAESDRKTAAENGEKLKKERDELADELDDLKKTEKGSLAFKYSMTWALSIVFFLLSCGLAATLALLQASRDA